MKIIVRILTVNVVFLMYSVAASAQSIVGTSTPPFTFDTTSTPVPLSGIAMGVMLALILGFLTRRHMLSRKKAGI